MRMLAAYHKEPALRFISHLDVQRTLHRALARADIPLRFSAGFNPHPLVSFASALATGMAGEAEWFDAQLESDMAPGDFSARLNAALPAGLFVSGAMAAPEGMGSLSGLLRAAAYEARLEMDSLVAEDALNAALSALLGGEIIVNKRTKSGPKPVDIRPEILKVSVDRVEGRSLTLHVLGRLQADGGLRMELFLHALFERLAARGEALVCRRALYFDPDGPLPRLPQD
ncbi:MAG: TIGR03936 family radical SAM-associated protein [Clostridia bacterium]|nr:TIGR03936 family radical SAM-associated protein [Clostridia bacterium]